MYFCAFFLCFGALLRALTHERNLICLQNQVSFNDIRSLTERVIYASHMIYPAGMIYACGRMKERILYHIATKEQYIMPCVSAAYHAAKPYIIIILLLKNSHFSLIEKQKENDKFRFAEEKI